MARMTDDEKRRRRHARDAAKKTAKEKEQAGIFAPLVRETTVRDEYWRWRFNKARAAENVAGAYYDQAGRGLVWIELHAIERYAARFIPPADMARLIEHVYRVYPMPSYGASVWCDILCGKQIIFGWRVECRPEWVNATNKDGRRSFPADVWPPPDWTPPHKTPAEFWALFPYRDPEPEAHDDGGLAERLGAIFTPPTEQTR